MGCNPTDGSPTIVDARQQPLAGNINRKSKRSFYHTVRTFDEVAAIMDLSRQRVHDIERTAFRKLRQAFMRQMPLLQYVRNDNGSVCGLRELEYGVPNEARW